MRLNKKTIFKAAGEFILSYPANGNRILQHHGLHPTKGAEPWIVVTAEPHRKFCYNLFVYSFTFTPRSRRLSDNKIEIVAWLDHC